MKKFYGLVGRTLCHSLSVPIHEMLGRGGYSLFEKEPNTLADFIKSPTLGGVNVTIPYKKTVLPLCDKLSQVAVNVGSVNTVFRTPDGSLMGDNTDVYGFEYMAARAKIRFEGKKVLVLGSGGASLSAKYCAERLGAKKVFVISRTGENNYENLSKHYDAEIIVNATPVGMFPNVGKAAVDLSLFPCCEGVLDMVYNPLRTAFLEKAISLKIPCGGGLSMLVAQAKAAEELFFGKKIDDSEIERILSTLFLQTQNIVLVGMPGSGKTTVGKLLSELLQRPLVDTDAEIEKLEKKPISQIFADSGEAYFRRLEKEVIKKVGLSTGSVITTGGGAVLDGENYLPLFQNSRIYFLERPLSRLARKGRPLSLGADLKAMYEKRLPLYRAFAAVSVENTGKIEDTAEKIRRDFYENSCY